MFSPNYSTFYNTKKNFNTAVPEQINWIITTHRLPKKYDNTVEDARSDWKRNSDVKGECWIRYR